MSSALKTAGAVAILATALAGCSGASHPSAKFGGYPAFLPKNTLNGGALHTVVDASDKKPALASQGDTVRVHLAHGTVLATVAGPEVPNEGLPYQAPVSPATWTVTLADATGVVPLALSTFTASDDDGKIYPLTLIEGQPALPATVAPGKTLTFKAKTTIKTGEGLLRWAPDSSRQISEWDFVVETD